MGESEPAAKLRLPATSWALLGLLSYGDELSGYDIRKWVDWCLRFFYGSLAHSQIYSELKKLEKLDLLTSRVESTGTRGRRLYKITDAGSAAVTHWAREAPVDPPTLKHGPLLRVIFGHLSEPARLKEALREHLAYADEMRRKAAKEARWARTNPSWAYARIALEWVTRYYTSERELTLKLIEDLGEAEAEFPSASGGATIPWPRTEYWYEVEKMADADEAE